MKKEDKNSNFTAGEESIIENACRILEKKRECFIYTNYKDHKEYVLELKLCDNYKIL